MTNKEKIYYCLECGAEVTAEAIAEEIASGGYGMCMCKFGNGVRILVPYLPIEDRIMRLTVDEFNLILVTREMKKIFTHYRLMEDTQMKLTTREIKLIKCVREIMEEGN